MSLYYWLEGNRTKLYAVIGAIAVLMLFFLKSDFWQGFAQGLLLVVVLYFLGFLFLIIWKNRKRTNDKKLIN